MTAALIKQAEQELGHVPIIEENPRRGPGAEVEADRARRYQVRTQAERFYSHLKDNRGGRWVRVLTANILQLALEF